jgi:predicted alpha/beta hydrolase
MTCPVVLISPAMSVSSRFYRPVVAAFEEHGWDAVALPRRGFERDGEPASRSNDWSYADEIRDIADVVAKVRAEQPGRPVILLGHSLGAQLGAGHQLHHDAADAFVVVGASLPYFRHYPRAGLPLLAMSGAITATARIRGFVPKPLFGAPGAATLMREWAHMVRTGRPPFTVPHPVTSPTLVVDLEGDTYALLPATQRFVDQLLDPATLTRWTYARSAVPEGGTTHHVGWAKTPAPVVDRIVEWWTGPGATDPR